MNVEQQVATHYTRGMLEQKILGALRSAGKNVEQLSSRDLELLDNLHVGGREAIEGLAGFMELSPGLRLLDVGCGIGGPARYFAERGCQVTGLTRLLKLDGTVEFRQGSALDMPFSPATFDGAYMIHVGMNIQDKVGIFREVARVLKRGGRFAIFDLMLKGNGAIEFPMPWAVNAETSFVSTVEDYRQALERTGFRIDHERERRQFALEFMEKMRERASAGSPPVLGVHILMGEQAPLMLKNVNQAMAARALEPVELVAIAG
jgi:ubiquinone/menaquinone biosynthesis C-methylase UbiE